MMRQSLAKATHRPTRTPGAVTNNARSKLGSPSETPRPVTDGLSVGPGATPGVDIKQTPTMEQYRLIAQNARNPFLRKLARDALRASVAHSRGN